MRGPAWPLCRVFKGGGRVNRHMLATKRAFGPNKSTKRPRDCGAGGVVSHRFEAGFGRGAERGAEPPADRLTVFSWLATFGVMPILASPSFGTVAIASVRGTVVLRFERKVGVGLAGSRYVRSLG